MALPAMEEDFYDSKETFEAASSKFLYIYLCFKITD